MPDRPAFCPTAYVRLIRSAKFLFIVSCICVTLSFVWIQLTNTSAGPPITDSLIREALENVGRDHRYSDVYRKTDHLPENIKYLLFWTRRDYAPFYFFGVGQKVFVKLKCKVVNCYATGNRQFFGSNLSKFDAIAINGRNIDPYDLPHNRSAHQKYIYINMESADNMPVCHKNFDGFFNWTSTYRLSSDIPYPYIVTYNNKKEVVGPKLNMNWLEHMDDVDDKFVDRLVNKSRAAAWFVSHCATRSYRMEYVTKLQQALDKYQYTVDVYGECGNLKCPRKHLKACNKMLGTDYYFYLSMENSFDEDYVTEKLLTALSNDVVPIVYGGANYSRFLPPGSYIDARKYNPAELAALMNKLIHSPRDYISYYKWRNHYKYRDPSRTLNVCRICEALNNEAMVKNVTEYKHFREWWYPNYKNDERC